jgi:hypothetical protein
MAKFVFNVMQSIKVKNDGLEHDGQAGHVVDSCEIDGDDTDTKVNVRMDSDNEVYEFDPRDLVTL